MPLPILRLLRGFLFSSLKVLYTFHMARVNLHESTTTTLERKGSVWKATYLTPGTGSSGSYGEEMLAKYAAVAFPKGTKHWFKHPESEGEQRDPRDQWGVTAEDARFEPGIGIVGKIKVLKHWQEVVESLAEEGQADLSIWAVGESDADGNVIELFGERTNSVDLIGYPGRPGSALTTKMFESARAASVKPPAASAEDQRKKENMEQWEKAIADLTTKFDASIAESKVAVKVAEDAKIKAEADAQAALDAIDDKVKEALATYKQKAEAIEAAELLPEQAEPLLAAAEAGEDIARPLAEAVKVATAFKKLAEGKITGSGRVTESATDDFEVTNWRVS